MLQLKFIKIVCRVILKSLKRTFMLWSQEPKSVMSFIVLENVPSSKYFYSLFVQIVCPSAGDQKKVMKNFYAMDLIFKNNLRHHRAVEQKLTKLRM